MAKYIETAEVSVQDQTVLEVGAGTGLPSILATLHGAKLVRRLLQHQLSAYMAAGSRD